MKTWKLNGPRVVELYSSEMSMGTGEMFCQKEIRVVQIPEYSCARIHLRLSLAMKDGVVQ